MFEGSLVYRASQGNTLNPCLEKQKNKQKREREKKKKRKKRKRNFCCKESISLPVSQIQINRRNWSHQIKDATVELTDHLLSYNFLLSHPWIFLSLASLHEL